MVHYSALLSYYRPLQLCNVYVYLVYSGVVLLITRLYTDSENDDDSDTCLFDFPPILENSVAEVFCYLVLRGVPTCMSARTHSFIL